MWKILTKEDIIELWLRSWGSKARISYAMTILSGRDIISRIANGIYQVSGDEWSMTSRGILDEDYWEIVRKLISIHAPGGAVVAWEKALELHLLDFSIPEILILYTRNTNLRIRLSDGKLIHFRTLVSWEKTRKRNLFSVVSEKQKYLENIANISLPSMEFSLLEALTVRRHDEWVWEYNVIRFLKRHEDKIDKDILAKLVSLRYIRAVNRLRSLAKAQGFSLVYQMCLDIIKKEGGGCFVSF